MAQKAYKTPTALDSAIRRYFRSISRTVTATELIPTGRLDKYGHEILDPIVVKNDDGEEIRYVEFVVPPRITALCRALKISKSTWERYSTGSGAKDEAEASRWREVCEDARSICEDWLKGEVLTRRKGVTGVIFELKANYGYSEKQEIEVKRAPSSDDMTMDEREAILRRLGIPIGGEDGQEGV